MKQEKKHRNLPDGVDAEDEGLDIEGAGPDIPVVGEDEEDENEGEEVKRDRKEMRLITTVKVTITLERGQECPGCLLMLKLHREAGNWSSEFHVQGLIIQIYHVHHLHLHHQLASQA